MSRYVVLFHFLYSIIFLFVHKKCNKNQFSSSILLFAFSVHSRFARAHNNPFSYPLRFLESRLLAALGVSCCHATERGAKYCARHFGTSFMKLNTRGIVRPWVRHIHSCLVDPYNVMASLYSDRSDHFPKIPKQRLVEAKPGSQLTYLEDSGVDVRELWRDHGNERQLYRNSPPMIVGQRKSGSQSSSRTSSPVQRRNEV